MKSSHKLVDEERFLWIGVEAKNLVPVRWWLFKLQLKTLSSFDSIEMPTTQK